MNKPVILCVDDEKMVLDSLSRQLSRELGEDYLLEFAESASEGLEIISEYVGSGHDIAVVISDQLMPEMSGDQFLIKVHELSPSTIKIMLTGQGGADSIVSAINNANLYRYIRKPWDKTDFTLTIKEAAKSHILDMTLREQNIHLQNMYQQVKELNANLEDMVNERTRELHIQKALFKQLFANSPDGIVILNKELRITNVNTAFQELFQYSLEEANGQCIEQLLIPPEYVEDVSASLKMILVGKTLRYESKRKRKDNTLLDVSITGYPIVAEGELLGLCAMYSDISKRKQAEEQLRYLSLHDALTGLYNRTYFEQEVKRFSDMRDTSIGVIICDVDCLKLVNDTLGHEAGDRLIQQTAHVLKNIFRPSDMVARIGGDEFAVVIPAVDLEMLERVCERIQEGVTQQNLLDGESVLSVSVGCAIKTLSCNRMDDAFKEADANMYRCKLSKSSTVRDKIMNNLVEILRERDFFDCGHADNLKQLILLWGRKVGLSEKSIELLCLLAQFHDIGKVGVPKEILYKSEGLTAQETIEIQKHCEIGYRIAKSMPDIKQIADWIIMHHEWWNGAGYPLGTKGTEVPLECRVFAIAEAYEVMTNNRPYRKAMSHESAINELIKRSGIQFDPELVDDFLIIAAEANAHDYKLK